MVAGLRPQKDHDTLIRAMAELPPQYELWLAGDGERRSEIKCLINELGLSQRIKLLGVRRDVPELLAQADVTVLSSHHEGLSLSSVECMASGRPFIAGDVPGLSEVVSGAGVLFPHGNHQALAQEIKCLCENPEHYREVAAKCQARASQFDIATMAKEYNEAYLSS